MSGDTIPLLSRILAVTDAYDAMTHNRPYRNALTHDEAVAEIMGNASTQFDPRIVGVFLTILTEESAHLHDEKGA